MRQKPNTTLREQIVRVIGSHRYPLTSTEIIQAIEAKTEQSMGPRMRESMRCALAYETSRPDGLFIRVKEGYDLRDRAEKRLKRRIRQELRAYGFNLRSGHIIKPKLETKSDIREFHTAARREKYEENKKFLDDKEKEFTECFADGEEVDIRHLWPRIEVVEASTKASDLFRYASFLWSVPVSQGFGRRVRFLVWDEHTDKLIGLFALGDPVFNLTCRDAWIGWTYHDRAERLYNVMDIFVLGSVPPYNILLGGKLVAMLASSNEVQGIISRRYNGLETVIRGATKDSRLALLTTGSALGKSSIYDRIRYNGRVLYEKLGESKGWGHFHLNHGLFGELREYLNSTLRGKSNNRFGAGPNWKMRTARAALQQLDLPGDLLHHGIQREIYGAPLASNFGAFLRGETSRLESFDLPFDSLAEYWRERWLVGRVERKPEYKDFKRETISKQIHEAGMVSSRHAHGRTGTENQVCD